MPHPSEAETSAENHTTFLVRAARGGDQDALDSLFARYLPRICRIAALRMNYRMADFADFEDIAQESLVEAFLHLPHLELCQESSFLNWMATIVQNNIADMRRKSMTIKRGSGRVRPAACFGTTVLMDALSACHRPSPSQAAIANETEAKLEAALLRLDDRHRKVIDLRKLCGMNYSVIAEEMGLGSESSARSLFARALGRLTELLCASPSK